MIIMPAVYNAIIGPAINHIVTPLPSGVIIAPKMTMITIAYRIFFLQKSVSVAPDADMAYITRGNWNENPNASKNCSTKVTKSITLRKVTRPADSPYLYKNSKMYGMTKLYEKAHPAMNNPNAGNDMVLLTLISFSLRAGLINPTNSLIIIGILTIMPTSAAMYTCAKNAWPGQFELIGRLLELDFLSYGR